MLDGSARAGVCSGLSQGSLCPRCGCGTRWAALPVASSRLTAAGPGSTSGSGSSPGCSLWALSLWILLLSGHPGPASLRPDRTFLGGVRQSLSWPPPRVSSACGCAPGLSRDSQPVPRHQMLSAVWAVLRRVHSQGEAPWPLLC